LGYNPLAEVIVPPLAIHSDFVVETHVSWSSTVWSVVNESPDLQVSMIVSIQCCVPVGAAVVVVVPSPSLGLPHPGIRRKSRASTLMISSFTRVTIVLIPPETQTTIPTIITITIIIPDDDILLVEKIIFPPIYTYNGCRCK
jgi:hypothetical protein